MNNLCPQKDRCGSCGWSHIPYDQQLKTKLADINGSFALKKLDLECSIIHPSPRTDHYRNRMDFVIDFEGRVGLREKGKWWKVIDDHTCFISDHEIERLFQIVRNWSKSGKLDYFDRKSHKGFLRYAVIRSSSIGESMVSIVTSKPIDGDHDRCKGVLEELAALIEPASLIWIINSTITDVSSGDTEQIISGVGFIEDEICGTKYRISPQSFFQTNSLGSGVLLSSVGRILGDIAGKTLLDLYCGTGFFSLNLSQRAKKVVGVELSESSIRDAKENAKLNNRQIDYFVSKTEDFNWGQYNAEVVLLDPPRSGMHDKALQEIIKIRPKELLYVSCNPKNFAREMVLLSPHYYVATMEAIDMFPHTPHTELIIKLNSKTI